MKSFLLLFLSLALMASAYARERTVVHTMDDSGRAFRPGDYINFTIEGQSVTRVTMDCRGERGATATIYIDGRRMETKRLSTIRQRYTWTFRPPQSARRVQIRFGSVDPQVYHTSISFIEKPEIKIKKIIQIKTVEVAKQQLLPIAREIKRNIDALRGCHINATEQDLLLNASWSVDQLISWSEKSRDSDASWTTTKFSIELIDTLDSPSSRATIRQIWRRHRSQVTCLQQSVYRLREATDYFPPVPWPTGNPVIRPFPPQQQQQQQTPFCSCENCPGRQQQLGR